MTAPKIPRGVLVPQTVASQVRSHGCQVAARMGRGRAHQERQH